MQAIFGKIFQFCRSPIKRPATFSQHTQRFQFYLVQFKYGLGGRPDSRGLFQFYQSSLIPCQTTKTTWQGLSLPALLMLVIKRQHHIRQFLLRFFQGSCSFIHRNHIARTGQRYKHFGPCSLVND